MIIDELVSFSNFYGSNEELVLAGGGNTSAKEGNIMYIKGSGTSLSTITADGFVKTDRKKLAEIFTKVYPDDDKEREKLSLEDLTAAKLPGQEYKRPSVETTLHSLFKERFVLHLHPALINGLTCAKKGKEKTADIFGNRILWVDACRPGYTLAKKCFDEICEYENKYGKSADLLLLQNHGIFIAADSTGELSDKLGFVISSISDRIKNQPDLSTGVFDAEKSGEAFDAVSAAAGEDSVVTFDPKVEAIRFSESADSVKPLLKPFNPDQIVYCKPYPVYVENISDIARLTEEYKKENGFLPKVYLVKDCGLFAVDFSEKGSETAALLFNDAVKIAVYAESFGGSQPMSRDLTDFIVNWEAEAYRSKQN